MTHMLKISDPNNVYTTTVFILTCEGDVYADNVDIGFFKHPIIKTEADLLDHARRMHIDGFNVDWFC